MKDIVPAGILLGALLTPPPVSALPVPPRQIADLASVPVQAWEEDFLTTASLRIGDWVYFSHDDGVHGRELWRTDGTAAGTALVADICPGACPSRLYQQEMIDVEGNVYFPADDGVSGVELWASEGTPETTRRIADVFPGRASGSPRWLTATIGGCFFVARGEEGSDGIHLTDGTAAGTRRVPFPDPSLREPSRLAALGPGVVFAARDDTHGREPWFTDGTTTVLLADVNPGSSDSAPPGGGGVVDSASGLSFGDVVLFGGIQPATGEELWRTDGTPEGTWLVADLLPGSDGSRPRRLQVIGDRAMFLAYAEDFSPTLWTTDGTAGGSERLLPVGVDVQTFGSWPFAAGGEILFFASEDGGPTLPWISDGTPTGTHPILDELPYPEWRPYEFFATRGRVGDRFLFSATDDTYVVTLWATDGTAAGTGPLTAAGSPPVFIQQTVHDLDGQGLFFAAEWLASAAVYTGREAWITDGTPQGTALLADIHQQTSAIYPCPGGNCLQCVAGQCGQPVALPAGGVAFAAMPAVHLWEIYRAGGRFGDPEPLGVLDELAWGYPHLTPVGDGLAFWGASTEIEQLWWSDGSGAQPLGDPLWTAPSSATPWGGLGFFAVSEEEAAKGLWRTDGTPGGTYRVIDAAPLALAAADGGVYVGTDQLLITDGTLGGTSPVAPGAGFSHPADLMPVDEPGLPARVFFSAASAGLGRDLWVTTDGPPGAQRLSDLSPGPGIQPLPLAILWQSWRAPTHPAIAPLPTGAVFRADDGVHGAELWVSDGTPGGTHLLADLAPGPFPSHPHGFARVGDRVFFVADNVDLGAELWVTDGTVFGTYPVRDLVPGAGTSAPGDLVALDDRVVFRAWTPATGVELWESDGSWFGTTLVADLAPGPLPSTPVEITRSGDHLYFFANDGVHGFEPWHLPLTATIFADGFESGGVEAWSEGEMAE